MSKKYRKKQAKTQDVTAQVQSVGRRTAAPAAGAAESSFLPRSVNVPAPTDKDGSVRLVEQRRAEFALQRLELAIAEPEGGTYRHSQLKSFLRRLPAMIQMNGFGQALAFYYAKRNTYEAYGVVYKLLEDWLCAEGQVYAGSGGECSLHPQVRPHLLHALTSCDQRYYRRAEAEALALLAWAKKFAEALILNEDHAEED